jgi:hypothetical protein
VVKARFRGLKERALRKCDASSGDGVSIALRGTQDVRLLGFNLLGSPNSLPKPCHFNNALVMKQAFIYLETK